jgi:hypothetical protein
LIPVEIKSAATFTKDFLKGIHQFSALAGSRCADGFVLYDGLDAMKVKNTAILNILIHGGLDKILTANSE